MDSELYGGKGSELYYRQDGEHCTQDSEHCTQDSEHCRQDIVLQEDVLSQDTLLQVQLV